MNTLLGHLALVEKMPTPIPGYQVPAGQCSYYLPQSNLGNLTCIVNSVSTSGNWRRVKPDVTRNA